MFVYVLVDTITNEFCGVFTNGKQIRRWVKQFDGYHIVTVEIPLPDTNA
jgi:hypothetical protein